MRQWHLRHELCDIAQNIAKHHIKSNKISKLHFGADVAEI
jgi:methyl coenzyme M reductase subunit C-like uncharacterized protein (methanogenesis marker protein 7)